MRTSILGLGNNLRFFLYREPLNIGKGIDALKELVREGMGMDPLGGDVFIFVSKDHRTMKLLHYDRNVFTLYTRKIYRGRFVYPNPRQGDGTCRMEWARLRRLLNGYVYNKKVYN